MCRKLVTFVVAASLAMASPAWAGETESLNLDEVRSQQADIRAGVNAATGIYEDMSEANRRQLLERQDRVLRAIDGKTRGAELTEDAQIAVFNDLEWIEAAINRAEDERMVCERRKQLGSNRKERVCMTVAQQREMRERARAEMMRGDRNMRVGN